MLISIIGNNASGKTTLAKVLDAQAGFSAYLESHTDRPYQALFAQEPQRYALHNQIDFLITRGEQEREIRVAGGIGVQDGGLDQDFFLYTHLFHHKGFLTNKEFGLCRRTYQTLRAGLPAPEVYIYLACPLDTLRARLLARNRKIDLATIATLDDLPILQGFLDAWVADISPLILQADLIDFSSAEFIGDLVAKIRDTID
jgi:deoxyadenosine/deoxycytidine kinase